MNPRADRLSKLPAYLFAEIDRKKKEAIAAGRDVIDFGVGDPDQPTPGFIVDRMAEAIRDPANHTYAIGAGSAQLRQAFVEFFGKRYGVTLDPTTEVVALLGSKEGIGHLPIAVVNPGDTVLVPQPGYPVYESGTIFAGGICHTMPLREENGWLPVLSDIPSDVRVNARLMHINYPNNPTGAVAPLSFFEEVVAFAREHDLIIAHDAPYAELYYDDPPSSILQVDGAKDVCIEFHSLSKTFNMTGWRIAFAIGNPDVLSALAKVKSNLDSGVFGAVQQAGIAALKGIDRPEIKNLLKQYQQRRDILIAGLREAGWPVSTPQATFYVWAKLPAGLRSMDASSRILDEADTVVIPGAGLGECGEGFVRFSLTVSEERTRQAVQRIASLRW
ncbi:MAG: LL-diaminopimelate aminotransferase [Phycisphaerales bacterium]|nr:MAG: LL-diaminopimelate aminotransferase [Phycisphaerales bacterium]